MVFSVLVPSGNTENSIHIYVVKLTDDCVLCVSSVIFQKQNFLFAFCKQFYTNCIKNKIVNFRYIFLRAFFTSMEQLNSALVSIKVLRARVGQVFETLGSGIRAEHGEEGRETKFLMELQELLNAVNNNLRYLHCK